MSFFSSKSALTLVTSAFLAITPINAQLYNKTIQTTLGPVQGYKYFTANVSEEYFGVSSSNVAAFLGIPYAADTGYQNRWKPAQSRESWNETLQATSFGPACPTSTSSGYVSEDCLSLNIWTNANSSSDKLPVLLWNQGSEETSDNPWWYGGGMAMKNVVMVTFNRRDDVLGYLATPELNAEGLATTGYNTSGNYGVLDQLEVLKWIQNNIANFGGDPDSVTIAGQSFGSSQVYHAVNSPLFTGYFHRGISQSGIRYPYDTLLAGLATSYVTMERALAFGVNYTAAQNVSTLAELRELPLSDVIQGSNDRDSSIWYITALLCNDPLIFKPVLDGYVLPMKYLDQLIAGPANDVPLITGNTKDESGASTSLTLYNLTEYQEYNALRWGNLSDTYFKLYPADGNVTLANMAWNAAQRDVSVVSSWAYANKWIESAASPIYTYYWDHAPPGQDQGAFHQSEIMYALNALYANTDTYPFTDEDYYIGELMTGYWVNFIRTGNPNTGGAYTNGTLPHWYPNDGISNYVMELGDGWGNHTVSPTANVDLIMSYFGQQIPY
ncbi:putative carboxylesterase protein [Botrytis fragariae]|uniref:Putative carboxylesterase protein n=1 Tax=Botrytis fragariae TaxID=1964551 RepID=A0A8H6AJ39_9HELO|nr:putative carboxylesterase protein [Botrytis fragariae]KAF5868419.1 putative carboxylesterase protein [Botrytis fragariae]